MTHLEAVRVYLSLPVPEREKLKKQILTESEEVKRTTMMQYIKAMFEMTGIDVTAKGRTRDIVDARAVVAYVLHEKGFREYPIGRVLNKDHSRIHNYIDDTRFFLAHGIDDPRIKLLNEYKQRIQL